jgi:transcriptional regulator with XRE-family HTH domain
VIYGARVGQARLFLGATQTQFAGIIGMSQTALSGLENETKPTEEFAQGVLAQFSSKSEMPARRVWISQQAAHSNVVEFRPGDRRAKRL